MGPAPPLAFRWGRSSVLKSLSIWCLRDNESRPAGEMFAQVADCGFEAIELAIGEAGLVTLDSTEEECRALAEQAGAHGLRTPTLASGLGWKYPLTADAPAAREHAADVIRRGLRAASWLGAEVLLVVPGMLAPLSGGDGAHVPYDVALERMREGIGGLVASAEAARVVMGIENVWNRALLSPLEMRDFVDSFGSDAVGAYFDVGNVVAFGYPEDWVRILGRRVRAVHLKDFRRSVGTLEGFCDLLEGDVDYPAVMAALREVGYDGPLAPEYFGLDEAGLRSISKATDRILAM
jgi:hexulose-6-phosphate isomerase